MVKDSKRSRLSCSVNGASECPLQGEDLHETVSCVMHHMTVMLYPEIPGEVRQSHNVPDRILKSHIPDFRGFGLLGCIQTIDPNLLLASS